MGIEYYAKLEKVDRILDELVNLKDGFMKRLIKDKDEAIKKIEAEFDLKVEFLEKRFAISADKALGELGETMPDKIKKSKKDKDNE